MFVFQQYQRQRPTDRMKEDFEDALNSNKTAKARYAAFAPEQQKEVLDTYKNTRKNVGETLGKINEIYTENKNKIAAANSEKAYNEYESKKTQLGIGEVLGAVDRILNVGMNGTQTGVDAIDNGMAKGRSITSLNLEVYKETETGKIVLHDQNAMIGVETWGVKEKGEVRGADIVKDMPSAPVNYEKVGKIYIGKLDITVKSTDYIQTEILGKPVFYPKSIENHEFITGKKQNDFNSMKPM